MTRKLAIVIAVVLAGVLGIAWAMRPTTPPVTGDARFIATVIPDKFVWNTSEPITGTLRILNTSGDRLHFQSRHAQFLLAPRNLDGTEVPYHPFAGTVQWYPEWTTIEPGDARTVRWRLNQHTQSHASPGGTFELEPGDYQIAERGSTNRIALSHAIGICRPARIRIFGDSE